MRLNKPTGLSDWMKTYLLTIACKNLENLGNYIALFKLLMYFDFSWIYKTVPFFYSFH